MVCSIDAIGAYEVVRGPDGDYSIWDRGDCISIEKGL